MNNFFKKAMLPLLVFGIAIAGVFATNSSTLGMEQPSQPLYIGAFYYQGLNESDCMNIDESMNCTIDFTGVTCTWIGLGGPKAVYGDVNYQHEDEPILCTLALYERTIP